MRTMFHNQNGRGTARIMAGLLSAGVAVGLGTPAQAQSRDIGVEMERQFGVVDDRSREGRALNQQFDEVVERIVEAVNSRKKYQGFQLRSAKILGGRSAEGDKQVNAFALPDGRIYVTLGLMRAVQQRRDPDAQLAFVIGHEVTHVVEKHSESQSKKALPAQIGAVLLGGLTRNRTLGQVGAYGAAAYSSKFGREDEYNADKGGLLAMKRAGYDLRGSVEMLKLLQSLGGNQNRLINGWFGSHPLTENRVARVEEMIADIRAGKRVK